MTTPDPEKTARIESDVRFTPRYASPESQFAPGAIIAGRYRIAGILGKGGMGEVYRADDIKLGQPVALKFLPARLARDPILLARLHDEVRLGRQVSHPNVCRIYDIAEWEGAHFVAMELVDGEDLARLLHRIGRLAHDKAVDIARGIAAGLMAAHAKGILHRDLKPANVLIDSHGDARITDFGLALSASEDQEGDISGTPAYMAPEQLQGAPASVQSDLYALGLVMYELFTGRRAHAAKTFPDRLRDITSEITIPSIHIRDIDPAVERIILRCLANDPVQRPRSAREIIEALPGGDPLAAAMAAGETPSPRIVAAAGSEGSLRPAVAWSMLGAIAALLALLSFVRRDRAVTDYLALDLSPEVLQHRAKEMLRRYGVPMNGRPDVWISENERWTSELREGSIRGASWEAVRNGPPPVLLRLNYGRPPRMIGVEPPLSTAPGRTTIDVDLRGRLYALLASPLGEWSPRPLDWRALLADAGLDPATLRSVPPADPPPAPFDARASWTGTYPGDRTPIRVDAAAWHGTPVFFRVSGEWSEKPATSPFRNETADHVFFALSLVVLLSAVALALRNLQLRRGDRQGALRVGAVGMILSLAAKAITFQPDPRLTITYDDLWIAVGTSMLDGAAAFFVYLALEPFMRRRWPEKLIAWTRLVAGRLRDPMVGRDVLLGTITGLVFTVLIVGSGRVMSWYSTMNPPPHFGTFWPLLDVRHAVRRIIEGFTGGFYDGFVFMTVLVILTMILRRRALAAIVFWLIFTAIFSAAWGEWAAVPIAASAALLMVFVAARLGLLALMTHYAMFALLMRIPAISGVDWASSLLAVPFVAVTVLALWAFRVSLGGTSPFGAVVESYER